MDRTGRALGHGAKCGSDARWKTLRRIRDLVPFRQRLHQPFLIQLGQGKAPRRGHRDIRRDGEDRDGTFARLDQLGKDVGCTAAAGALARPTLWVTRA